MSVMNCPECNHTSVKRYEFGGFWCGNCLAWYTTREIEMAYAKVQAGLKVRKSRILKIDE